MKLVSSNRELYEYLTSLALDLERGGSDTLGDIVAAASRQAVNASTEF